MAKSIEQIYLELDQAYNEVVDLINNSCEHGSFNSLYFRKPFIQWYTKKIDNIEQGRGADNPSTHESGVANNTASTTLTHSDPSVTL